MVGSRAVAASPLGAPGMVGLAGLWWRRDDGNPRADNR